MSGARPAQPPALFDAVEHSNVPGPIRLDPESVEAVAQRVAELLRETPPPPPAKLVSAAELARTMNLSRDWIYSHATELGAVRVGSGKKARLRFELDTALSSWVVCSVSKRPPEPEPAANEPVSRRRKRRSAGTGTVLLPIGTQKARPERPEGGGDAVVERP